MLILQDSGGNETTPRRRPMSPTVTGAGTAPAIQRVPAVPMTPRPTTAAPRVPGVGIDAPGDYQPPGEPAPTPTVPTTPTTTSTAPNYRKLGTYQNRLGAWSTPNVKYNDDWNQMSERYKLMTFLSNWDPSNGITKDLVDALNKEDWGGIQWGGEGDWLTRNGVGGDIIGNYAYGQPSNTWGAWAPDTPPVVPESPNPTGTPSGGGGTGGGDGFPPITINFPPTDGNPNPIDWGPILEAFSQQSSPVSMTAAPQMLAPQMAPFAPGPSAVPMLQTVGGQAQQLGVDPFMAWLRAQGYGGPQ